MRVHQLPTRSLGDHSYLVVHDSLGVLVDPQRDTARFLQAASDRGVSIVAVFETHLHNDYVSGGRIIAEAVQVSHYLPAAAGAAFDYEPAFHLEDIEIGSLQFRPLHTPGHTPEHTAYILLLDGRELAVFTGGSLLVGSAGRTDLLDVANGRSLARLQYGSLQRIVSLPGKVDVFPTHGKGSFCSVSAAQGSTSTVEQERRNNPHLRYSGPSEYADKALRDLPPCPDHYTRIRAINTVGPGPIPSTPPPTLSAFELAGLDKDTFVVDCRTRMAFLKGHVPDALSIEASPHFSNWITALLPFAAPLALIVDPQQDVSNLIVELARVGFDDVRGVKRGLSDWRAEQLPIRTIQAVTIEHCRKLGHKVDEELLLDVRTPQECADQALKFAVRRPLTDLNKGLPVEAEGRTVTVVCHSGYRATIGASLLRAAGHSVRVLAKGGVPDIMGPTADIDLVHMRHRRSEP